MSKQLLTDMMICKMYRITYGTLLKIYGFHKHFLSMFQLVHSNHLNQILMSGKKN